MLERQSFYKEYTGKDDNTRRDVKVNGFWGSNVSRTLFDVKYFQPLAKLRSKESKQPKNFEAIKIKKVNDTFWKKSFLCLIVFWMGLKAVCNTQYEVASNKKIPKTGDILRRNNKHSNEDRYGTKYSLIICRGGWRCIKMWY